MASETWRETLLTRWGRYIVGNETVANVIATLGANRSTCQDERGSGIVADLVTDPIRRRIFDNVAVVIELDRHPLAGQWFTVADIATLLGVREATIRGWVSRGRFPRPDSHVGAVNVWRRESVEQWQAQRPRKGWQQRGPAAIVVPAALTVGTQVLDQLVSVIAS